MKRQSETQSPSIRRTRAPAAPPAALCPPSNGRARRGRRGCTPAAAGAHEEREFEDGEHKARPLENVRGKDVYVIQSLHGEPRHERQRQADPAAVLHRRAARTPAPPASPRSCPTCATPARTAEPSRTTRSPPAMSPSCSKRSAPTGGDAGRAQSGCVRERLPLPHRAP